MAKEGLIRGIVNKVKYVAGELQSPPDPGHPDAAFREPPKGKGGKGGRKSQKPNR